MNTAHTPAWHAVPDAVGVARQLRPADLRGFPATLRYGASLSGVALAAARGRPRTVLLVDQDGAVTGAELESAIDAVAGTLAAELRRTRRREVALCCDGHRGFVAAVTAAGALGVDVTVVPARAGSRTLEQVLGGVEVAIVDDRTAEAVAAAAPAAALLDVRESIARPHARSLRSVPRPRRPGGMVLLTSGTTGLPRSVQRGGAALGQLATVLSLMHALDLRRDEAAVIAPPLGHGHGLSVLTAALVVGAPAVLAQGLDGAGIVRLVREHCAAVLTVVPAQLAAVLDVLEAEAPGGDQGSRGPALPTLRRVATGSAPLPAEQLERARRVLGEVVVDFYGSSEVGTATIATPEDLRDAPGTVGRPAAGVRVEVVDAAGEPVPAGVVGEVRVSSPWAASSSPDGLLTIGDRGHLDDEGRLFLDGRSDGVVVVGGYNVSVARVRDWFAGQPGVETVQVSAVEHAELGHELLVTVTGDADLEDLQSRALAELGSADAPRRVERRSVERI